MRKKICLSICAIFLLLLVFPLAKMPFCELGPFVYAQDHPSGSEIVLVLDNSGSMKKNDPEFLTRDVVTESLIGFGDNSRLAVVIFDSQSKLVVNLMETNSLGARAKILKSLTLMDYMGLHTNIPSAIERAIYELKNRGRKNALKIIILLTDGLVDTGNKRLDLEKTTWLKNELTQECVRSGIHIFGIAFTESADFSLIQTLALKTDGEYFRAFNADDLRDIFKQIKKIVVESSNKPESTRTQKAEVKEISSSAIEPEKSVAPAKEAVKGSPSTPPLMEDNSGKKPTQWKSNFTLPIILSGIFVLMVIILSLFIYSRRARDLKNKYGAKISPHRSEIPPAVLLDVNNITGKRSLIINKKVNRIGRDPNNDIIINKDTVSSLHAIIEFKDGFFYLEDQRSVNKTILSGQEIEPHSPRKLKSGDEILFNIYKFRFVIPDRVPFGKTTIDFRGRSHVAPKGERLDASVHEIHSIPRAILMDVNNITGKKTINIKKRLNKIGRGQGNDIIIPEEFISGLHATIEYKDGFFYLEDQRSKNKTNLGGEELEPHSPRKLKSGDEIMFANHKFIFLLEYELPSGDTGERTV